LINLKPVYYFLKHYITVYLEFQEIWMGKNYIGVICKQCWFIYWTW